MTRKARACYNWKARICRARRKAWKPRESNVNHWSPKHLKPERRKV